MPEKVNIAFHESDYGNGFSFACQKEYPVYPSCEIALPEHLYSSFLALFIECINVPCVFFDGINVIVPESYVELVDYMVSEYSGCVTKSDQMKEHEFATIAIAAGVNGNLVRIGDCIAGLDGTAQEMLEKALSDPIATKAEWDELYLASMNEH